MGRNKEADVVIGGTGNRGRSSLDGNITLGILVTDEQLYKHSKIDNEVVQ